MLDGGRGLALGLFVLLGYLWLRFFFHADPGFPGSIPGTLVAIAGALLLVWTAVYSARKRMLRARGPSLRGALISHSYVGVIGALLVVIHSGHKYDNPVGVMLTLVTLLSVVTGYAGLYFLPAEGRILREGKDRLGQLSQSLRAASDELQLAAQPQPQPQPQASLRPSSVLASLLAVGPGSAERRVRTWQALQRVVRLVDATSDVEMSRALHGSFQRWFRIFINVHVAIAILFYVLLGTHVLAVTYYGLRWLR